MNKGQGFAVGAFLAAALLLRPPGTVTTERAESSKGSASEAASPAATQPQEGPWIASCYYWAPARQLEEQPAKKSAQGHATMEAKVGQINLQAHLDIPGNTESSCGSELGDRWGFPKQGGPIDVTAIIATVPDPVHTHLGMIFDRAVDAILQAASDNNYVSSYYWLPWKHRVGNLTVAESPGGAEPGHDPERERQPGLMILKHVPSEGQEAGPSESFYKVIYLFLVAETPTEGIDGSQFQYAFSYEGEMKSVLNRLGGRFSSGREGRVAIIGPQYSGSAASLRVAIETAHADPQFTADEFDVTGETATQLSVTQLTTNLPDNLTISYQSFDTDIAHATKMLFADRLALASGYDLRRAVLLVEDNTVLGDARVSVLRALQGKAPAGETSPGQPQVIRFPREISLLRNAQVPGSDAAAPSGTPPSPFLRFSLKDYSAQDSVPQFSRGNTPFSQEAQLMSIAQQLRRLRAQFVGIVASNALDEVFLAQFLHRACPDARLVFFEADLLMEREVDNVPFIGSISITPYPLVGPGTTGRTHPSSPAGACYNAASYAFWDGASPGPVLLGYTQPAQWSMRQAPFWLTAIGSDGYYPLAILGARPKEHFQILPAVPGAPGTAEGWPVYPSRLWDVLCALVCLLCVLHSGVLLAADYWSPMTRDLAILENDQPMRRSLYVHVATAMLCSMAFVVSMPVLCLWPVLPRLNATFEVGSWSEFGSILTVVAGVSAVITALVKTRTNWAERDSSESPAVYGSLNLGAAATLIVVPVCWWSLCCAGPSVGQSPNAQPSLVGLSFCYRSINPGSGVSPLLPVLLVLFSWYLWALFQTWRLRFSDAGRPLLPESLDREDDRYFVSDNALASTGSAGGSCLYHNITCRQIIGESLRRWRRFRTRDCVAINIMVAIVYAGLLAWPYFLTPIRSLDHFLFDTGPHRASPYEFLVGTLSVPLIVLSLAGCLRMILIWSALRRGLLDRLESMPIRYAFSRLKGLGWMTMLRHEGLREQRRGMARCMESMRQLLHQADFKCRVSQADRDGLDAENTKLLGTVNQLQDLYAAQAAGGEAPPQKAYCKLMREIESEFAKFSQKLLSVVLIPYWKNERTGLVESEEGPGSGQAAAGPPRVLVAEEFLAIRYISVVRAVLENIRYLMMFVSAAFVLAMLAWNSYPFQPRQLVDWVFTGLLAVLGLAVVWVFAQMHRNPILSRITRTKENELGWDFYIRVISFGAVPVLTWLAYQFPDIGSLLYKLVQPGVPVMK